MLRTDVLHEEGYQLGAACHFEFPEDAIDVRLYGPFAQKESFSYFLVPEALHYLLRDLLLPVGESFYRYMPGAVGVAAEEQFHLGMIDPHLAVPDDLQGFLEKLEISVGREDAVKSVETHQVYDVMGRYAGIEQQELGVGPRGKQTFIQIGEVDQDDVRLDTCRGLGIVDRYYVPLSRLPAQQLLKRLAEEEIAQANENGHCHALSFADQCIPGSEIDERKNKPTSNYFPMHGKEPFFSLKCNAPYSIKDSTRPSAGNEQPTRFARNVFHNHK